MSGDTDAAAFNVALERMAAEMYGSPFDRLDQNYRIMLARGLRAALHVADPSAEIAALRAEIAELQDVLRLPKAALQEARAANRSQRVE